MSELKIKLENLQCTLTDPVSAEDIRAAWYMVSEIISDVTQLEDKNEGLRDLLSRAARELIWFEDEGPTGEGWKSDKLMALMADIKALGVDDG